MTEKAQNRCWDCPHIKKHGEMGYYPYLVCGKCKREVKFDDANGWDRMVWCPLLKEEQQE